MKTLLIAVALGALAGGAFAAGLDDTADRIRAGTIDVGKNLSMAADARYHTIHAEKVGLGCTTCHVSGFPADYLLLRKDDRLPESQPGPVDRAVCLGCHSQDGPATTFYGPAAGK
ncbi:MAG: hypothetical protein A3E31_17210 [Candidatus Rokubacteria bacterium RIFCSPHIGHO2_12_FULL_73_22]|nr:MAG: hypothetical protein A3D33_09600 [Candidatus Rokubacteria bacterium RIFCSPHIGHO2_02_FULL_73_26]OGL02238.1 MAG: hypothetical protein A3E31_17210 [Candidatus Rokubacteria bacterium RIFCSPHIGHO2_12_FULL_73_22]OGL10122.1 MAG: hypothetical protein A3I14_13170 [Candidatus Rokubacteria bacterium RIFCSPLOWO2_02_FULL_73_56]OGL28074.1 MAG: hypothetical protein A3G44_11190 [Candidatus Rokubacteria bacterium RIFCSPLOWO2_12_FULL_73_47]